MRVVQLGFGSVGRENVRQLLARGHAVVGVVDVDSHFGADTVAKTGLGKEVVTSQDLRECLSKVNADVILEATSFHHEGFLDVVKAAADVKCDVVSVNGIVNISRMYPQLHTSVDALAKAKGIRVVGAGVVPGFLTDLVPLVLTGACASVDIIKIRRRTDFTKWGQDVMTRYGFGLTQAEFDQQAFAGSVVLFKNLWQSVHMLVDELRWDIQENHEVKQPHISTRPRRGDFMMIESGTVGGFLHRVSVVCDGNKKIEIEVEGFVDPQGLEEESSLTMDLLGNPNISVNLGGDLLNGAGVMAATSATMVNILSSLKGISPGLKSIAELPLIACRN